MGRYRAPEKRGSAYITAQGYALLQAEYETLWKNRAEVTKHLAAAAAEGDRSENAEYIYRKKQLREMDRRIRYLLKRLDELNIVSEHPSDTSKVFFGAWVSLEDELGETHCYRIVGPDELDPSHGYISVDAPLARVLMKKKLDDEVVVTVGEKTQTFIIIGIRY